MKTANEIIKILAEKNPYVDCAILDDSYLICYYCDEDFQGTKNRHDPDCLWLEMQQIAQESISQDVGG